MCSRLAWAPARAGQRSSTCFSTSASSRHSAQNATGTACPGTAGTPRRGDSRFGALTEASGPSKCPGPALIRYTETASSRSVSSRSSPGMGSGSVLARSGLNGNSDQLSRHLTRGRTMNHPGQRAGVRGQGGPLFRQVVSALISLDPAVGRNLGRNPLQDYFTTLGDVQQGLPYLSQRRGWRPHLGGRSSTEYSWWLVSRSTRRRESEHWGRLVPNRRPEPLQSRPRGECAARSTSVPKISVNAIRRKIQRPPCAEFSGYEVTPDVR